MWLMKTLLTSGCTNQRGAGHDFDVLAEAEEMNHSITDFDINLRQHSSKYEINIDTDNLYANPTDGDVEYDEDDWR